MLFRSSRHTFIDCSNSSESNEGLILVTTRLIIRNFIITKSYSHGLTLRLQVSRTFRFHVTIPLTSKTLKTYRIIRRLTYFFSRFFSVVNLSGIILPKISKFNNVLVSCPSVVVSKKITKVLGKLSNLCSKEIIIKSTHINRLESH